MPHPLTPVSASYLVSRHAAWQKAVDFYEVADVGDEDCARDLDRARAMLYSASQAMGIGDVLFTADAPGALALLRRLINSS